MKNSNPSVLNNNKSYELGRFFVSDTIIYWCTNMNLVVNMDNYISLRRAALKLFSMERSIYIFRNSQKDFSHWLV